MTINHCPIEDLNPYAKKMAILALQDRIAKQREFIARMVKKREDGEPLYTKAEPVIGRGVKYKKVSYYFFVWDGITASPYDYIKDAELRIEELKGAR